MIVSERQTARTLDRMKDFLRKTFPDQVAGEEWKSFEYRLERHFGTLLSRLFELYGHHFDFYYHLERLVEKMAEAWLARPADWKGIDAMREADRTWFQSGHLIGGMLYVDLFAGDLVGLKEKIPYLKELGITYLHLMPIYARPEGDNDGGYAVNSYRELDRGLGSMSDLQDLSAELRRQGISLVLDFVFNHTSDQHDWAEAAKEGDETCQDYYLMFDSRDEPDQYERHLREIFPDEHEGSFTYVHRLKKWVWTTFHTYQWDLNYRNPEVFNAMAGEMLFLANQGVEVLRMDAVPFIWKQKGTSCENLPEAHILIQAFNAVARVVAPSMVFKSEAIVAPDDIKSYIAPEECQISYNPLMMALLWESLATRGARLLQHSMRKRLDIVPGCSWVNYVRSHDDIGWGFDNGDAGEVGIDPHGHRHFLNLFYLGRHEASFAEGEVFQDDPKTGDARVCGTTASLCGLGRALADGREEVIELALRRIHLLHGVSFTIGGIPLISLGEEIGLLNDFSYREQPGKAHDSRWVHRPPFDWQKAELRQVAGSVEQRIYEGFLKLSRIRLGNEAIAKGDTRVVDLGNEHVFAYFRTTNDQVVFCVANFSEQPQNLAAPQLRQLGVRKFLVDIISGQSVITSEGLSLEPLQFMVLLRQG
ncbi:MAG: alpha-amylase family glycosyl hydrolase [Verrucomicrobiales bacterium]